MFIVSKRNFVIPRADGTAFKIAKDFIGEIPADVSQHWLVQAGLKDGTIAAPATSADREIYKADAESEKKIAAADIRPDAKKSEDTEESPAKSQSRRAKAQKK